MAARAAADGAAAVPGQPDPEAVEDAGFGLVDDGGRQVLVAEAGREAGEPSRERVGHGYPSLPQPPLPCEGEGEPACHPDHSERWRCGMDQACAGVVKRGLGA